MKIFKTLDQIKDSEKNAIVAVGNFDGVHKGHQALLAKARAIAAQEKKPLAVLTFEPHPRRLFRPDEPPSRITPQSVKLWRLQEEGVQAVYTLEFNWDFASQSADDFIEKILKTGIGAAHIVVGDDFCFGQLRKGCPADIHAHIPTTVLSKIGDSADIYSSSRIRQYLRDADIIKANDLLGWEWEIRGHVIKGDQRGRTLGYPTANVQLEETIHPAYGIYAAWVQIEGEEKWHASALNIGIRPMFEVAIAQLEAHILDFDRDIYGKILRVKPVQRLRGEAKFKSLEELVEQMAVDCQEVRNILF